MSKAEELADALMMQAKTLRLAGQNDAAMTDIETSAAELRRLAALEEELNALKSAIKDAEPVAWLSTDCLGERYLCFTKPNDNDPVQPLYTLNGIKK